jgi:hypothetical protein
MADQCASLLERLRNKLADLDNDPAFPPGNLGDERLRQQIVLAIADLQQRENKERAA